VTFRVRKCDLVRSDVSYLYERNAPKKTTQTPYGHLLRLTSVDYIFFLCIGNPLVEGKQTRKVIGNLNLYTKAPVERVQ